MKGPEIPYTGKCWLCGKPIPNERKRPGGRLPRYHAKCSNKMRTKRNREKRKARRAWDGLGYKSRTADQCYFMRNRRKNRRGRRIFLQTCECGETFWGGNQAKRCLSCAVRHERIRAAAYWKRYKARRLLRSA